MSKGRRDLLMWAVENLDRWPVYPDYMLIDSGGFIHSIDWVYARKSPKYQKGGEK